MPIGAGKATLGAHAAYVAREANLGYDSTNHVTFVHVVRRPPLNALINYLIDNLMLDFQGDLALETVRHYLRDDDSQDARALLAKLAEDRGVSDMMITLADCLKDYIRTGITEEVVREQIRLYAES